MNAPVSVIIPCYNDNDHITTAIESLKRQSYTNLEIIVIDDCSNEPLDQYSLQTLTSHHLVLLRNQTNIGANESINRGFDTASGDYFCILAADDELPPNSIDARAKALENGADLVFGATTVFKDGTQTTIPNIDPNKESVLEWLTHKDAVCGINNATALFSRELQQRAGYRLARGSMGSHEDYEYALRLILHAKNPTAIATSCYSYKMHPGSMMDREIHNNKQAWLASQVDLEQRYIKTFLDLIARSVS